MNRDNKNDWSPPPSPEPDAVADRDAAAGDGSSGDIKPVSMDVHAYIGRQLRAVYDDVAKQPIPDRLLALMAQLDTQDPTTSS